MIKESDIGTHRYVIPGYKREAGYIKIHIIMIEPALVPGLSIRLAAYYIIEYLLFAVYIFQIILNGQMGQRFGSVHWRVLVCLIIDSGRSLQILLLCAF